MKNNEINLIAKQRKELEKFSKTGVHSAKLIKRAEIILLLDTSESGKSVTFEEISTRLGISVTTITKVKKDFFAAEDMAVG
jgi:transcriptional antiterminator